MYNKNMYFKARLFIYYGTAQGTLDIWLRIEGGGADQSVVCFVLFGASFSQFVAIDKTQKTYCFISIKLFICGLISQRYHSLILP